MANYERVARRAAARYGLNPNVFVRQIRAESDFNPRAGSPAGARGIAQIMPSTARSWGVNPDDPVAALNAAAKNMAAYVKKYGSYRNALVAYNAGPGRVGKPLYSETANYIQRILPNGEPVGGATSPGARTRGGSGGSSSPVTSARPVVSSTSAPDVTRRQLAAQWLLSKSKNPNDLLYQIQQAGADNPAPQEAQAPTPRTTRPRQAEGDAGIPAGGGATGSTPFARVARQRADIIDRKHLPYLWGGGHGGRVDPARATPLDCSGAVSAVLGINPRVSGQFQTWGRPGRAPGGRGITIYSNAEHVLMEIDGHFWGTSQSNPGKGAGWIPRSQISAAYLSRFTARHSRR